jgi:hypothetical protein
MGSISKVVSTVTGGILGAPKIKRSEQAAQAFLDPNRGSEIAAARKRKAQAAAAAGRSNFRIDLTTGGEQSGQTRGGLTIG